MIVIWVLNTYEISLELESLQAGGKVEPLRNKTAQLKEFILKNQ